MFSSKAIAIRDPEVADFIKTIKVQFDAFASPIHFIKHHREWLVNNTFYINGLDEFENAYVTAGVTEAFNEVYKDECFVLEGEYSYHKDLGIPIVDYKNIPNGSRLIISYPFAATGNPHNQWKDILNHCEKNNIKIFVDACLAGVSLGRIDLRYPCITHIAFSFSKAFNTGHLRSGVVYTKSNDASPASITNKHFYLNHLSMVLHTELMNQFSSDFIFHKHRLKQIDLCKEHSLIQSDCVLFGLDNNQRKCLSPALGNQLPFGHFAQSPNLV
tara:strand:+ start:119 stop:934 length:816 start_codon:yes stop_codon:yes gene_type:complete